MRAAGAAALLACACLMMVAVSRAAGPTPPGGTYDAKTGASSKPTGTTKPKTTAPVAAAKQRDYGTYCSIQPEFSDNVTLSSDADHAGLRVGQKGTLRIFVTNTAKMDLIDVALDVQSDAFTAEAKPWSHWAEFPDLKTMRNGGKPQAFEVTLTRKPNVPDGQYEVTCRLLNLRNRPVLAAPLSVLAKAPIPVKRANVTLDGRTDEAEWGAVPLCTALCDYRMLYPFKEFYGLVLGYEVSKIQTRFRMARNDTSLYFCVDFLELPKCASDVASIYVARSLDAAPVELRLDRLRRTCTSKAGNAGIRVATDEAGRVFEIEVPTALFGLEKGAPFYADFARVIDTGDKDWPGSRHTRFLYDADKPNPYYQQKPGLRLAADKDNAYCKLDFAEIETKTRKNLAEITFYILPDGPTQGQPVPRRFILNTRDRKVACSDKKVDTTLLKYEVAENGKTATLSIPRRLAAIEEAKRFFVYAHFVGEDRTTAVAPIQTYWRGNQYSILSPYVYEKFVPVE